MYLLYGCFRYSQNDSHWINDPQTLRSHHCALAIVTVMSGGIETHHVAYIVFLTAARQQYENKLQTVESGARPPSAALPVH